MLPLDSKVCDFIDVENKCWDLNLLNRTFLPFEAEVITVRNAYKLGLELETNKEPISCFAGSNLRQFQKRFWPIQIPHKIRHFAWRATRDIWPTKENLVYRTVLVDSVCEECSNALESFFQLFWECLKAQNTQGSSSLHFAVIVSFQDFL